MNFESYSYTIAFFKIFCFADTRFDEHNIAAIFGKHRSLQSCLVVCILCCH